MSNYITVTYKDTQPDSRSSTGGRCPRVVFVDVSDGAVAVAARAGIPAAYTHAGRVQMVLNILRVMGIEPATDGALGPIITSKRGIANRGFEATVWVRS